MRSEVSKLPRWVVGSKVKRSMTSALLGPIERRLSSAKVMPTDPSGPVAMTSDSWTLAPTGAGCRVPARSIQAAPRDTLIRPASAARAAGGSASATRSAAATRARVTQLPSSGASCHGSLRVVMTGAQCPAGAGVRSRPRAARPPVSERHPVRDSPRAACSRPGSTRWRAVAAFVEEVAALAEFTRHDCLRLTLVLEELFTNTVEHGYGGDSEAPVQITCDVERGRVAVTYEDAAPRFDPLAVVQPPDAASAAGRSARRGSWASSWSRGWPSIWTTRAPRAGIASRWSSWPRVGSAVREARYNRRRPYSQEDARCAASTCSWTRWRLTASSCCSATPARRRAPSSTRWSIARACGTSWRSTRRWPSAPPTTMPRPPARPAW